MMAKKWHKKLSTVCNQSEIGPATTISNYKGSKLLCFIGHKHKGLFEFTEKKPFANQAQCCVNSMDGYKFVVALSCLFESSYFTCL